MADFNTVQGDLEPPCTETLFDIYDEPMDFAGAELLWRAQHRVSKNVVTGVPVATGNPGELRFSLEPGQSDEAGDYDYCWVVTKNGRPQSFPHEGAYRHWRNKKRNG